MSAAWASVPAGPLRGKALAAGSTAGDGPELLWAEVDCCAREQAKTEREGEKELFSFSFSEN